MGRARDVPQAWINLFPPSPGTVPITAHINQPARLRVHHVAGRVTANEYVELFRFYGDRPQVGESDLITFINDDADPAITLQDLDMLRAAFSEMQLKLDPHLVLRSVWVCPNVRAWRLLEVWLKDRHSRDGLSTEPFLVAHLDDAVCAYDAAELDLVRSWIGFEELVHFDDAASAEARAGAAC